MKNVFAMTVLSILIVCNKRGTHANQEGDALTAVKSKLTDPSNALKSWDNSLVDPCTWFHVTCINSKVTRIDLGNNNLSGVLDSRIGELTALQYLELFRNSIHGLIPLEIGNLTNLVSLDLYQNNFNGRIPMGELSKLPNLKFIRLNHNNLSGCFDSKPFANRVSDFSGNPLLCDTKTNRCTCPS